MWGHKKEKQMLENKAKSGKTTVTPSCLSALDFNLYNKKSVILPIASQP